MGDDLRNLINENQPSSKGKKIMVHFKFKDVKDEYRIKMTRLQYENLKAVKDLEFCDAVLEEKKDQ